jgi:hypothetical protein
MNKTKTKTGAIKKKYQGMIVYIGYVECDYGCGKYRIYTKVKSLNKEDALIQAEYERAYLTSTNNATI